MALDFYSTTEEELRKNFNNAGLPDRVNSLTTAVSL